MDEGETTCFDGTEEAEGNLFRLSLLPHGVALKIFYRALSRQAATSFLFLLLRDILTDSRGSTAAQPSLVWERRAEPAGITVF